jgi:hypothetical protein
MSKCSYLVVYSSRLVSSRLVSCRSLLLLFVCLASGERDGPLHFLDSSKAPTPASRYGGIGHYSLYHPSNYSGSITPLSCYSHPFEMMHIESLREKLNRLTRDKGVRYDLLDTCSSMRMFACCYTMFVFIDYCSLCVCFFICHLYYNSRSFVSS